MDPLAWIGERRIAEAVDRGDFDDLPDRGRRIDLEDVSALDDEVRCGYLALKSAGYVPEELELKKHVLRLQDLLDACRDPERQRGLQRELTAAQLRFELMLERSGRTVAIADYRDRVHARLGS